MKKICAILLVLSLSMNPFNGLLVKADTNEKTENEAEIHVLELENENELYEQYDKLNEVDVIRTEGDTFTQMSLDDAKEVLDNGTDFLVVDVEKEYLEDVLETTTVIEEEESGQEVACYVTSENSEYKVLPVYVGVLYDKDEIVSDEEHQKDADKLLKHVKENEKKHLRKEQAKEIRKMQKEKSEDNLLAQLPEEEVAALQVSTLIGDSFCENGKLVYFYKEGSATGTGTDYVYSTASSKTGWSKMGSLDLNIYGIKMKTIDNTTFDNIYSVVTATGLNDKFVKQLVVDIGVAELSQNLILDQTMPAGGCNATNGRIMTQVAANGTPAVGGVATYAFNPSGQNVVVSSSEKYKRRWGFNPAKSIENKAYKVRPAITLKKTNGKTTAVTAFVTIDSFQVSGGLRTYTIKDNVTCQIKFRNHVAV